MPSVLDFIENNDVILDRTEYFAAILGESPSKGAKSPTLWNAAFKGLSLSGCMHPMDVQAEMLEDLVAHLKKNGDLSVVPLRCRIRFRFYLFWMR